MNSNCLWFRNNNGPPSAGQALSVSFAAVFHHQLKQAETLMLWTIFVILLVLWALGMVTSTTLGGFIHLLLLIAVAVVLIRVIQGRPAL